MTVGGRHAAAAGLGRRMKLRETVSCSGGWYGDRLELLAAALSSAPAGGVPPFTS